MRARKLLVAARHLIIILLILESLGTLTQAVYPARVAKAAANHLPIATNIRQPNVIKPVSPVTNHSIPQIVPINSATDPAINAVGDIAPCSPQYGTRRTGYKQTAALLSDMSGPILGLGDYAYYNGSPTLFSTCFDKVWGALKSRIDPAVGNHEYLYPNAAGYYGYFGVEAGDPAKGYYSFNVGTWHIVALNSNCKYAGGCGLNSPQLTWLKTDLAKHPAQCTLAYWHHPLFGSGREGSTSSVKTFWQVLYADHADIILNGHDHSYERFAPMDPNGVSDPANGLTEFVVGTGGMDHSYLVHRKPNSIVFQDTTYGVLRLILHPDSYEYQFVPVPGSKFTDEGTGVCH